MGDSAASSERSTPYTSADEALQDVERGLHSWAKRHWADILVPAAGLALLVRFAFVAAGALWPPPAPRARLDLPAFTVLRAEHVKGAADSVAKRLAGRYLLRPVRAGSLIRRDDLGPATLAGPLLAGRRALPLLLPAGAVTQPLKAGMLADLVVSPTDPAARPALIVERAPVLAATPAADGGAHVVFAVTRPQLDSLAPWLGSARIFALAP